MRAISFLVDRRPAGLARRAYLILRASDSAVGPNAKKIAFYVRVMYSSAEPLADHFEDSPLLLPVLMIDEKGMKVGNFMPICGAIYSPHA
jgi:hypothetical protein